MKVQNFMKMKTNAPKSFRSSSQDGRGTNLFWRVFGVQSDASGSGNPTVGVGLWQVLERVFTFLKSLIVATSYQQSKRFPGAAGLPWFRIVVAVLLLGFISRKNIAFQMNFQAPDEASEHSPQPVSSPVFGLGLINSTQDDDTKPPLDPFEDSAEDDEQVRKTKAYIRRYKEVAVAEMQKFGIPASIKMAQAIIETNAGQSKLATSNNNHFGVKCFSSACAKGHCSNFSDDHHKDFFRKYESAWASWRAHSQLLSQGRYKELAKHGKSYQAWAKGLSELGYATDPKYTDKLLRTIQQYQLHLLDKE